MKVNVVADIHNRIDVFNDYLFNHYEPNELLVQLGDFSFSSKNKKDFKTYIYFYNLTNNSELRQKFPNFILLKGNHEKQSWLNINDLKQNWNKLFLDNLKKELIKELNLNIDLIIPSLDEIINWFNELKVRFIFENYIFEHGDLIDYDLHEQINNNCFLEPTNENINITRKAIKKLNERYQSLNKILVIGHFVIPSIPCYYNSFEPIIMSNLMLLDNGIGYDKNYKNYIVEKMDVYKKKFIVTKINTSTNEVSCIKFDYNS